VRREVVARVRAGTVAVLSEAKHPLAQPEVVLDGVTKRFAPDRRAEASPAALQGISIAVARGEFVVIVGPSGCGKSTALRIVAGLEEPDAGTVSIAGRPMKGVPPQDRDVAMVFQGYALYPQMTAREILEFPLKMRRVPREQRAHAVDEAASLLRIERLLDRRPDELSGGERQRVAMGRAIVRKPRVFLFDEPLSNLDASLRGDIRVEIGQLVRRLGATALYVTHDHVEAMTLADRIAVMRGGRLLQLGTPKEIYDRPATSFVGGFLGSPRMNLLPGRVDGDSIIAGPFRVPRPREALPLRVEVGVRPEHVVLEQGDAHGEVIAVEPLGAETHLIVRVGDLDIRAQTRGFDTHRRGDDVLVSIDPARAMVFDAGGDNRRLA
jgi:multiple sugar transport system ATP-binding protein